MVKRIFGLIRKQYGGMHEAALLLGFFSLISQLLGLIRDRALVSHLGPSLELDVYYAAFRIPDFVFTALASLVAVTALMPFLIQKIEKSGGDKEARVFMDQIFSAFMGTMLIVCLGLFICMPFFASLIAPGFSPYGHTLLTTMSRIMLLSPILLGIQNLLGSIVQMHKRFFIYALAPVLYNTGILIGVFFLYPIYGVYGLAYGVVLGAFLHLSIQIPTVYELDFVPRITWRIKWREIFIVAKTAFPRTITLAMNTFVSLILIALASRFAEGSISILSFAFNLQSVPIMIISVSYAVASFPGLVELYALGKKEAFLNTVSDASRQIIFWSLPITTLFIVLRAHIVRVVYGTHALSWNDTRLTAALFAILSLAIIAHSLSLVFIRAYYASGKTTKPFMVTVFGALTTCVTAFFLTQYVGQVHDLNIVSRSVLRLEGVPNASLIILGISYILGHFVNLFLFWFYFRRDFGKGVLHSLLKTTWVTTLASLVLGSLTYLVLYILAPYTQTTTFWAVLSQGLLAGFVGMCGALFVMYVCKSEELRTFTQALRARFWKATPISPGHESFE